MNKQAEHWSSKTHLLAMVKYQDRLRGRDPRTKTQASGRETSFAFFKLEHVDHSFCLVHFLHCLTVQNTNVTRAPVNLAVSDGEFSLLGAGHAGDPQSCFAAVQHRYCPTCKNDTSEVVKAGEKLKASKKKAKMPSATTESQRDWGKVRNRRIKK